MLKNFFVTCGRDPELFPAFSSVDFDMSGVSVDLVSSVELSLGPRRAAAE
jgi:hypothetical protein